MKMVKSLLLGSAAGLVAITAGQAADLPVKAKPVEYVKVCSLYGAGFYYMPGTDMCLKVGGWARAEITDYSGGNMAQGPIQGDLNNRTTSNLAMRARGYITVDAREQTAYGVARAYLAIGIATTDIGNTLLPSSLATNRAFVQWAGITAGETQSFYDFYSAPAMGYRGYMPSSDTGDPGWWLWAYTAQLGNGVTATISAEQRRASQMCDVLGAVFGTGGAAAGACSPTADLAAPAAVNTAPLGYGGNVAPDILGNIRVDQTWGSAQVMAVAHNDNAPYYGATGPINGGPADTWGWAVGAGLRLNFPMIAQGDYFQSQVNYTEGAVRYVDMSESAGTLVNGTGNTLAYGLMSDCVYGSITAGSAAAAPTGATGCNLTTAWGVNAGYEHYWTPQFHESFVGGYMAVSYNQQANGMLCLEEGVGTGAGGTLAVANAGCNNNWAVTSASTRFQYDVTKSTYLGVEFLYQHYTSATFPGGVLPPTLAATEAANGYTGTSQRRRKSVIDRKARLKGRSPVQIGG